MSDYRIMSNNIWGQYFENPVESRTDDLLKVYKKYAPDVLGFQESDKYWHAGRMFNAIQGEYEFVRAPEEEKNYTSLLYKRDRFELVDSGYILFDKTPDPSKSFMWGVLKDKNSGFKFGVGSLHYWWMTGPSHDVLRCRNSCDLLDEVRKIREKHGVTVLAFGDYNCFWQSEALKLLYANGGKNALDLAAKCSAVSSHHGDPIRDDDGRYHGKRTDNDKSKSLDHIIFFGDDFKVDEFRVVEDQCALDATDHSPIYADITVK